MTTRTDSLRQSPATQEALWAAVAYIVGRLVTRRPARSVFDHAAGAIKHYGGEVSPQYVDIFDHQRHHHVAGTVAGQAVELYDYDSGHRLLCEIAGGRFTGFDYASRHRYRGHVSDGQIALYDHATREQYHYDLR
jgi:hypothetical protein